MEAKTNYSVVGAMVLLLTAGLISVGLWLSVGFEKKKYLTYTVYFHESVSGLNEQAPVKYNGVQVGFVKKIKLNTNDPRQVEVLLDIEEGTPITNSTYATLISQGITGITYLGLAASAADLIPIQKMPDEPYPVIPAKPSLFNQLDTVLKEVGSSVKEMSDKVKVIFNDENAKYINTSLKNADVLMANLAHISKDFPGLMKEFRAGAVHISQAGKNISTTMVSGKNTLDQVSQDAVTPLATLIRRLNAISANLEQVSNEMRQNPAVIIRGTKSPKSGPGE